MNISQKGIDLIKISEGFMPLKYDDCGYPAIGYGHRILPTETIPDKISLQEALDLLKQDIKLAENCINKRVKVPLTQGQFDSLVSLIFNWGTGKFTKSEGLKKLNEGDYDGALVEFQEVVRSNGKIIDGLVKRRAAEAALWNENYK